MSFLFLTVIVDVGVSNRSEFSVLLRLFCIQVDKETSLRRY